MPSTSSDPSATSPSTSLVWGAAVLTLLAQPGCSTHYQPRSRSRVSVVMEGGNLAYERGGTTTSHGLFGSGLVEAVGDDPAALEAAETYHARMVGGFVADLIGVGCFAGGTAWALSSDFSNSTQGQMVAGASACLLAGVITGTALILSAQPYHWDAINIYNDNAELRQNPVGTSVPQPTWRAPPAPAAVPSSGQR